MSKLIEITNYLESEPTISFFRALQSEIASNCGATPCVYFLSNLNDAKAILSSGRLLPSNAIEAKEAGSDLSSSGAQARRGEVWLGNGSTKNSRDTHDCLNFYLNPINYAVDAFCRNQLVLEGPPLRMVVFEFSLREIAEYCRARDANWAFSKKNIAKNAWTESRTENLVSDKWPWKSILSTTPFTNEQEKMAEFLLWLPNEGKQPSAGLPISLARRLLGTENSKIADAVIRMETIQSLKSPKELLDSHIKLTKFTTYSSPTRFNSALSSFAELAQKLPLRLELPVFANQALATSDIHGIPHVARVMLWVHVLIRSDLLKQRNSSNLHLDAVFAALLHDLQRRDHQEDKIHGQSAARRFRDDVERFTSNDFGRTSQILDAVEYHCRPDLDFKQSTNTIYKILKDADALDRGRFSFPCQGKDWSGEECEREYCEHKGCAYRTLRLDYEGIPSKPEYPYRTDVAWAARNLALVTRSAPWDYDKPIEFLVNWLTKVECVAKKFIGCS